MLMIENTCQLTSVSVKKRKIESIWEVAEFEFGFFTPSASPFCGQALVNDTGARLLKNDFKF